MRPRARTCCPALGVNPSEAFFRRNIAQRNWASRSFKEKYQWPEDGAEKFDNSPSTQTTPSPFSRRMRTSRFRRETVKTFRPASGPVWRLNDMKATLAHGLPGSRYVVQLPALST